MSEYNSRHGKREAPSGGSLGAWWAQYRNWLAGQTRGQRVRWRALQAAAVVSLVIIAVALWLQSWIKLPEVPSLPDGINQPVSGSQVGGGGDASVEYEGAELPAVAKSGRKPGYYTFLLAGRDVVSGSTDTMMLVTYDTKSKTVKAITLLRDTMINTSGKSGGQKRLNAVFARNMGDRKLSDKERVENGMAALKKEVGKLTGIYPDFYVLVEWEAIGRLVDAVGGVEFEVPFDMDYDDPYQDLHIHQKKGLRKLDGQDAMEVVRFRKNNSGSISLGDVGRTQIQRDFMTAVLKKCLTPEILLKLPTLVDIFMDNVDTDLTVGNILAFAQLAVGMDVENGVDFVSMPYYGVSYGGASLVCVQEKELLALLNDGINPYVDDIQSSDLQLMYKKKGGGFGVTSGTLADPSVANPPPPKVEEPEEPEDPVEGEDPLDPSGSQPGGPGGGETPGGETNQPNTGENPGGETNQPNTGENPGGSQNQPPPGGPSQGTEPQPPQGEGGGEGEPSDPAGELGAIDPSQIFPDPNAPLDQERGVQPAA